MNKDKLTNKHKKYKKWKIAAGILIFLLLVYVIIIYFVVSAALVPSFMEKLDAFEEITVKSYAAIVQTDDIHENQRESREHMKVWLNYILSKDSEAKIVLHGQSMGAATALMLTGDGNLPEQVVAAISDAAYTDGYSMFADKAWEWITAHGINFEQS